MGSEVSLPLLGEMAISLRLRVVCGTGASSSLELITSRPVLLRLRSNSILPSSSSSAPSLRPDVSSTCELAVGVGSWTDCFRGDSITTCTLLFAKGELWEKAGDESVPTRLFFAGLEDSFTRTLAGDLVGEDDGNGVKESLVCFFRVEVRVGGMVEALLRWGAKKEFKKRKRERDVTVGGEKGGGRATCGY